MAKIDTITEQRIKSAANIADVLRDDLGVELHRKKDGEHLGLCPFHGDRHLGSFVISERKNIATCFSCGKSWDPIAALMEGKGMKYHEALRHLAARYGIYIDDAPVPQVKRAEPRPQLPPKEMLWFAPADFIPRYAGHEDENPLLRYLFSLPLTSDHMARLMQAVKDLYLVGTSTNGETQGWTIWWQIDDQMRLRTGKLMKYTADGHRDKTSKYNMNWMHSMLAKIGRWDTNRYEKDTCLFGLHLVDIFPNAEICIVESEKTAVICSAFTDPNERLWMATGGLANLNRQELQPLIDRNRYIVLFPDIDGYPQWTERAKQIDYPRLTISNKPKELHLPIDGNKADIADIMLRTVQGIEESPLEIAVRRLNATPDQAANLKLLIDKLHLTLQP